MYILGISCFYHESAAAIIKDGKILAAIAEERLSRKKHDNSFPKDAIAFCLQEAGISAKDLSYVVFYEKPFLKFERIFSQCLEDYPSTYLLFLQAMKNLFSQKLWIKSIIAEKLHIPLDKILFVPHHLSHAAAAFYPSPFQDAAFLTVDGTGEWTTTSWGIAENNQLFPKQEMRFPHSIGLLYATFTAYLGFEVNDGEYKVMGMAAYGKPKHINKVKKLFHQFKDRSIQLNLKYFLFQKNPSKMYSKDFEKLFAGLDKFDIAASIQKVTEELLLNLSQYIKFQSKKEYLVFGGGVALNSVANALLAKKSGFKDICIFPASGDDGGAVGAALYVYYHVLKNTKRIPLQHVFLGKSYKDIEIEVFLKKKKIAYKKLATNKLVTLVAKELAAGKVVGWFEGRSEFGPRALGHRSILADPRKKAMKDIVNTRIKFREEFRPFAPVILEEEATAFCKEINSNLSKYMLGTFATTPKAKTSIPATIHIDGSSRLQTLPKDYPGRYRTLIEYFYHLTGIPALLNTSFNLKGEPIVQTPEDAYDTFLRSGLDLLVIENYLISK